MGSLGVLRRNLGLWGQSVLRSLIVKRTRLNWLLVNEGVSEALLLDRLRRSLVRLTLREYRRNLNFSIWSDLHFFVREA